MTDDPSRSLDDDVAGCAASHQALNASLRSALANAALDPQLPSLLPGWTVGHVLTHLARNADALRGMIEGASIGEKRLMYPSADARAEAIEAGASRPSDVLVDDVRQAAWALESSWARLSPEAWAGHGVTRAGLTPVALFPRMRWREVEVHHADIGMATFRPEHWSAAYVAMDLPRRLADWEGDGHVLPAVVAAAAPWLQLAWLLGRDAGAGFPEAPSL